MGLPSARFFRKNGLNGKKRSRPKRTLYEPTDLAPKLNDDQRRKCPLCERPMIVKRGARLDVFWGCPRFPCCRGTVRIDQARWKEWLASIE